MNTSFRRGGLALVAFSFLSACASAPQRVEYAAGTDAGAKVSELRTRMNDDVARQYDQMSPDAYDKAREALDDAQEKLAQREPAEDVLKDAGKAAAYLQVMEQNGSQRASQLEPVINARKAAIDAQAPQLMKDEFAEADQDFHGMGRDIEKGDFQPGSGDIAKLQAKYSEVELKAVKKSNLGDTYAILESAKKRDAKSKAPVTFDAAQVRFDNAQRAIEANRRDPSAYRAAVADAKQSARKLDSVLNTIGNSKTTEEAAVRIYDQQQELVATREDLSTAEGRAHAARQAAAKERQTNEALRGENAEFAHQAEHEKKIEAARAEFSEDEAEVVRDGSTIIVRLKAMKFPTARAELTKDSLETLQKVKDMIAAVPVSKVIVEGHTDNVGTAKRNLALSQSRAETVKQYLVSEESVPANQIEARGLGFQRPLTSNKTAEGRAINRRVDILIDTDSDY